MRDSRKIWGEAEKVELISIRRREEENGACKESGGLDCFFAI